MLQVCVDDAYQLAGMFQACKFMTVGLCNTWQARYDEQEAEIARLRAQLQQRNAEAGPVMVEEDSSSSSNSDEENQAQFDRRVRPRQD